MTSKTCITTSWDNGHRLDLKLAERLAHHGLEATFYVPRACSTGTMSPDELRELSSRFEIGAQTLDHVVLTRTEDLTARQQIEASKDWIEQTTGRACRMFCPPTGRFTRRHLRHMRDAGFVGFRTVELLSLDRPRYAEGLLEMPTTVQAYSHRMPAYARNFSKRLGLRNLWLYILQGYSRDWVDLARGLLERALQQGGVFHLWGHSWELQEQQQWRRLEEVFSLLGQAARQCRVLSNGNLCEAEFAASDHLPESSPSHTASASHTVVAPE